MADYDIHAAFAAIENELLDSMMRNMKRHRAEEDAEGFEWTQWQALQLKALKQYKKNNKEKFEPEFKSINQKIRMAILNAHAMGNMEQEASILEAISKGFSRYKRQSDTMQANFFRLNERKLNALVDATIKDMEKAEHAVLRMADDQYRKAIFNAQVYANTGAGTYEKAVDMATKDMLAAGLNCVQYKNGARHTLESYAEMALRTASKRAYLQGEGEKREEWGIHTVIMNKRGNPCPLCLPWVGRVLIDDVWSGGTAEESKKMGYPLMSTATSAGLYHPNCRDSHTTYFEGISTPPSRKWTKRELEEIERNAKKEARKNHARRQAERFGRLAKFSLDEENKRKYRAREEEWESRVDGGSKGELTLIHGNEVYERNRSGTRVVRKTKSNIKENKATNVNGQEIVFSFDDANYNKERVKKTKELITQLANEYDTYLTTVGMGAKNAAGSMDVAGDMLLSNLKPETVIHEFGHSLANTHRVRLGLAGEKETEFLKELTKIRTRYENAVHGNPKKGIVGSSKYRISAYSHDSKDEFLAEAFTQAKMKQMGLELPSEVYGSDMTYSDEVLELVDKYFKKEPLANTGKSSTIKLGVGSGSKNGKSYRYELGQIDVENTELVVNELSEQIRQSDIENAIVIDKNGKVVHFKSSEQDSVEIFDIDLDGATVTHNHPKSNGIISFGKDDFELLQNYPEIKKLFAVNPKYTYSVEIVKSLKDISYSDYYSKALANTDILAEEIDVQHDVFEMLNKEGYIKYVREEYIK